MACSCFLQRVYPALKPKLLFLNTLISGELLLCTLRGPRFFSCEQNGEALIGPVKYVLMHQMRDQVLRTDLLSKSLLTQTLHQQRRPEVLLETTLPRLHPGR